MIRIITLQGELGVDWMEDRALNGNDTIKPYQTDTI